MLISGQRVVVINCEKLVMSGPFYRNKCKSFIHTGTFTYLACYGYHNYASLQLAIIYSQPSCFYRTDHSKVQT